MTLLSQLLSPANAGIYSRFAYLAASGQTVFSGADLAGLTLTLKPGYVEVYVNGRLVPYTEYTVTSTSVTFATGLSANDAVYVVALSTMSVGDTYSKTQEGADITPFASTFRSNIGAAQSLYTWTILGSGSGSYSPPGGCRAIRVRAQGAGGGGSGGSNSSGGVAAGGQGGTTTFSGTGVSISCPGGYGGAGSGGGFVGAPTATGGDLNVPGGYNSFSWGAGVGAIAYVPGTDGAPSRFGSGGRGAWPGSSAEFGAAPGSGGGGGGGATGGGLGGAGGGSGSYAEKLILTPETSYSYAIGAGGAYTAGANGGGNGNVGGNGLIIVEEYY